MSVDVVLAGVGGYGATHLNVMRPAIEQGAMRLVGAIDPAGDRAADWADLQARGAGAQGVTINVDARPGSAP